MKKYIMAIIGLVSFVGVSALAAKSLPPDQSVLNIGMVQVGPRQLAQPECGSTPVPTGTVQSPLYYVTGLQDGLAKLGYASRDSTKPSYNLDVVTAGIPAITTAVQGFVTNNYNIIVAVSTSTVDIAKKATATNPIPVLFPDVSDPVGSGYAASLTNPGGNITGVSPQLTQSTAQRLIYFQRILGPQLKSMLVIYNPTFAPSTAALALLKQEAATLNIQLVVKTITTATSRADITAIMQGLTAGQVSGIFFLNDTYVIANADVVFDFGNQLGIPIMGVHSFMADWGAVAAYPSDPYGDGFGLATYVDNIVQGQLPATMAITVQDPYFVINQRRLNCLNITLSDPIVLGEANNILK